MSTLVTASTGRIGTQILNKLQGQVDEVRALTRSPDNVHVPQGVTPVRGELGDVDSFRAALAGVKTLFLLAPIVAQMRRAAASAAGGVGQSRPHRARP